MSIGFSISLPAYKVDIAKDFTIGFQLHVNWIPPLIPPGATGAPENGSLGKKCGCSCAHCRHTNTFQSRKIFCFQNVSALPQTLLALGCKTRRNTFGPDWFHPFNSKGKVFTWPALSKIITTIQQTVVRCHWKSNLIWRSKFNGEFKEESVYEMGSISFNGSYNR